MNVKRIAECAILMAAFVTWTASPVLAETVYDTLSRPPESGFFPDSTDHKLAQPFLLGDNDTVTSVEIGMNRRGSVSGTVHLEIWDDNGAGSPGRWVGTLGSVEAAMVGEQGDGGPRDVFESPVLGLTPYEPYYLVMTFSGRAGSGWNGSNRVHWGLVHSAGGALGAPDGQCTLPGSTEWVRLVDYSLGPPFPVWFFASVEAVQADCNANGVRDRDEIAAGMTIDDDANGVPDECEPNLVGIMDGATAGLSTDSLNTFISPRAEDVPLNEFTLEATEDLELVTARTTYTGAISGSRRGNGLPKVPEIIAFTNDGGGRHTVVLDYAPEPGQWLKLTLVVRGPSPSPATFTIWLAHHPGDINQDGGVDIRDATAFGDLFRNGGSPVLVDLNGDGMVDIRDASTFGRIWKGEAPATQSWEGSMLPEKPE